MKVVTYMMASWLAFVLCRRPERARRLLDALILIGAVYAAYAFAMAVLGVKQLELFYSTSPEGSSPLAAPFVTHAAFATFTGMVLLCTLARLFSLGIENINTARGIRPLFLSTLKFGFGRGTPLLIATIVLFSMLVASASRAGFLATMVGALTLLLVSTAIATSRPLSKWTVATIVSMAIVAIALFLLNGAVLQRGFDELAENNATLDLRSVLWRAAAQMASDAWLTGIGLGNFEHAYPLYADHIYPFNMDKAHNDFVELAAGWGIAATALWLSALLWLVVQCGLGVVRRRRNRIFPLVAIGTSALVAFHAMFDFTLQIPAVAITYAVFLGLGVSQSFSTRA